MIKKIDGKIYADLVAHGIKNLEKHRDVLNRLNVFPVPDGDTGTNMFMTLRCGQNEINHQSNHDSLPDTALQFSSAAVFGARGNSGVIISQFFKGMSETFKDADEASPELLARALEGGMREAYAAVVNPVEGTMLTVMKDASAAVMLAPPQKSIDEVIDIYLEAAEKSLENTPELLPILKKAGVVDSGGSGVVYFFQGVQKYLRGEEISLDNDEDQKGHELPAINPALFNRNTDFRYGYCVEGLLQLTIDESEFSYAEFNGGLSKLGNSLVSSVETDKVKIHIHSSTPGNIINYCQRFGEMLTLKIENMTVQNVNRDLNEKAKRKFLCADNSGDAEFAVVAVASSEKMQQAFVDMGADVVILSEIAPSSQDFLDAFEYVSAKRVLVFPNSPNSILASMQAGSLYKKAKISVANSRSVAECYAALAVLDFGGSVDEAIGLVNDTIANVRQVFLYRAANDTKYGSRNISKNDFFALQGKKILAVDPALESAALRSVQKKLSEREADVITVFYGQSVTEERAEDLASEISALGEDMEVATVSTMDTAYDLIIIFE